VVVDQGQKQIARPHRSIPKTVSELPDFQEVDGSTTDATEVAVETRIDVIRLKDVDAAEKNKAANGSASSSDEPMDEALNYLLRQLRDSQSRKTA
jgi:hypothetical protein